MATPTSFARARALFPVSFAQVVSKKAPLLPLKSYKLYELPHEIINLITQFLGKGRNGIYLQNEDVNNLFNVSSQFFDHKINFLKQKPRDISYQLSCLRPHLNPIRPQILSALQKILPTIFELEVTALPGVQTLEVQFAQLHLDQRVSQFLGLIFESGKKLRKLSLTGFHLTYLEIKGIGQLPKLKSLDLRHTPTLRNLHLTLLTQLKLHNLQLGCSDLLTNTGVFTICKITTLRRLELSRCPKITNQAVPRIATLPHLQALCFEDCDRITNLGVQELSKLPNLRRLSVANCPLISNPALQSLAAISSLRSLNISGCIKISNPAFLGLTGFERLTHLDMSGLINITNSVLSDIARFVTITNLNLSRCVNITSRSMDHFLEMPYLARLDIRGCEKIAQASRNYLKRNKRSLKIVS
jgi:Leucine-rich repeat (LRR) protein